MKNPIHGSLLNTRRSLRRRGFALVVTLSLMILLTVVSVALLTLSSVTLRSSANAQDIAVAKANARMALMLALGELQRTAGSDTRVTARADLLDETNSPVLGVWKSWEGKDHDESGYRGRPITPDYADHKKNRFLSWLVSGERTEDLNQPVDAKPAAGGKVALLGEATVGPEEPSKRQVHLEPVRISTGKSTGTYAWWVGGENQKARLPRPYAPAAENAATWSGHAKSHGAADPGPFGLDDLLTHPSLSDPLSPAPADKVVSLNGVDLLTEPPAGARTKVSREFFHDLSATSVGLLTNTATGGWRKDLSLAAENWNSLPSSGLPLFRLNPTTDLLYNRPTTANPMADNSLLYHWSSFRRNAPINQAIWSFPAISSWANLVNYATMYKGLGNASANGVLSTNARAESVSGDVFNFAHKVRVLPVIARVQWVYSHLARPGTSSRYDLYLQVTPVITLWNPYNVKINGIQKIDVTLQGSLPPVIQYKINGALIPFPSPDAAKRFVTLQYDSMAGTTAATNGARGLTSATVYTINNLPAFGPGETRVFSPSGESNTLVPGYTPGAGVPYLIAKNVGAGSGKITTSVTFDSEFEDGYESLKAVGVGLYMNMDATVDGQWKTVLAYRMSYDKPAANLFYPAFRDGDFQSVNLSSAVGSSPFLLVTFGARMASTTFLPSKGFVQASPFVNYTAMGQKGMAEPTIMYAYPGTMHNVNSPFEYSFKALTASDPEMPGADPATNRGYILTGFTASQGLSRCVISELPGRPMASLAELQNWDARYENPVPPYAFNLIGNSDASPLLPANAVFRSEGNLKRAENLQHDDSYCLNHALFDDWFLSGIAPTPNSFGAPPANSSIKTTYMDLLTNPEKPLANRAYRPIAQDLAAAAASDTELNRIANANVMSSTSSWKTIASRLEVEGMFNVNSTSVKAWRSLLGHARNQRTAYLAASGELDLSSKENHPVSRFSIAGDSAAGSPGSSGDFSRSSEFAGYRLLEDSQLDTLAEKIVEQVRARGPFLSLSEFVNRQLASGNLAMAGAIQTALNELAATSGGPFDELQANTRMSSPNPPSPAGRNAGYANAQAAQGYSLYGVPGWTRQADILRPLAPILSARDDTFVIRAYGDCRDSTGRVIRARAYCEATVCRTREYVDPSDDAALATLSGAGGSVPALRQVNQDFGRRFEIVSFRWLAPNEI